MTIISPAIIVLNQNTDFVMAFYNPGSKQRTWQLEKAREILLRWRSPQTSIILARNLGRSGQSIEVKTLAQLTKEDVNMQTIFLVGSSQTRTVLRNDDDLWVYTPRQDLAN